MTRLKIGEAMPNDAKATPVAIEPEGDWYGLYKGSTSRDDHLFEPASVRHPAKMSLALTNKILDTMQEWGWIETGSLVVDPFGGRGTTALCWLARNAANRALTVELEPHFVEMQNRNKEHAERRLHRELAWVILQGDSRRFDEYYAEGKAASVLSAPYGDSATECGGKKGAAGGDAKRRVKMDYVAPQSPANIGNLPDSAITSAPYAMNDGTRGRTKSSREWDVERGYGHMAEGSEFRGDADYGDTPGQIGRLKDPPAAAITSAPYGEKVITKVNVERLRALTKDPTSNLYGRDPNGEWFKALEAGYINSDGNIDNLPDGDWAAAVLSAPYAAAENRRAAGKVQEGEVSDAITRAYDATNHGQTAGQIANLPDKDVVAITSAPYGPSETATPAERVERRLERIRQGVEDGTITGRESVRIAARGANHNSNIVATGEGTGYGSTPGQIGNLPDACVTSAPYGNQQGGGGKQEKSVQDGRLPDSLGAAHRDHREKQSAVGQIANLPDACVTSAPFENSLTSQVGFSAPHDSTGLMKHRYTADTDACVTSAPCENSLGSSDPEKSGGFLKSDPKRRNDPGLTATYGDAAGVTSPPYENSLDGGEGPHARYDFVKYKPEDARKKNAAPDYRSEAAGANQQGQIGVLQSETYAQACGLVYASLAKAGIRYVASVTKDPVKNKKLRPLRLLTISLFEQAGYRLVAWRRAWLYHTQAELDAMAGQESLFGDEVEASKRLVGRLSFFRRLSLNRGGIASPFEDVLFFALKDEKQEASNRAVCEHGIPQGQYCAPCDDDYIARQEASPVGQPAQPPRWVQPELF